MTRISRMAGEESPAPNEHKSNKLVTFFPCWPKSSVRYACDKKFMNHAQLPSVLLFCLAASALADVQTYTLTDLGTLPGQTISHPAGINNQAQVTVTSVTPHALLFENGLVQDLGTLPGGSISTGVGINGLGQVVGDSQFQNGGSIRHAVLFSNGTRTDLGFLPESGNYSRGNGINNLGEVVGHSGPSLNTRN